MTTSLTTLQPAGKSLPAAFQGHKAASAFAGQHIESGAEGLEGSYGVIKYAGKVFSLQIRGENHVFIRPDDGTARGSIDVIVTRAAPNKAKTYYTDFKEGSRDKPICWSNDGQVPDAAVPPSQKGAASCGICPRNVFGSKITDEGKKSKQCGDHKRLAVVLDPALAQSVLGIPLSENVLLRVPAASLSDFGTFAQTMEAQGFPLPSFISRISFDITKNYPKLKFEALRPLTEDEAKVSMALRDDPGSLRIIADGGLPVDPDEPGQQAVSPFKHQVVEPVSAQDTVEDAKPTNVTPLNVAPRPTAIQQAQAMKPEPEEGEAPVTNFDAEIESKIGALLS